MILAATTAWAVWTLTSNLGYGKAKTGALSPITLDATFGTAAFQYPAGVCRPGQDCPVNVMATNPAGNGILTIKSATIVATGATTSNNAGCPVTNFTFQAASGLSIPFPEGANQLLSIPGLVTMKATAPTACAGVTIDIPTGGANGITITADAA